MKQTTTVMNYSFDKTYYENFLHNRVAGITGSGKVNVTIKQLFLNGGSLVVDNINTIDCIGHVDFKNYVKRIYNGDRPECIDEKVKNAIHEAGKAISTWDDKAAGWIDNTFGTNIGNGSYICTEVTNKLNNADIYMPIFNKFRDNYIFKSQIGIKIFKEYRDIAPLLIKNMKEDIGIYEYLFNAFLISFQDLILNDNYATALDVYFDMLDYLCERYSIKPIQRVTLDDTIS